MVFSINTFSQIFIHLVLATIEKMGSLMSGWDSPFLDPESLTVKRNRSLTKEEIEAFWKVKKQVEDEHIRDVTKVYERSSSMPSPNKIESDETDLHKLIIKNGWWRRSNSAFLNEPPVFEGNTNTYASQFHVAKPKPNNLDPDQY